MAQELNSSVVPHSVQDLGGFHEALNPGQSITVSPAIFQPAGVLRKRSS
jgi:hypothetical protein